jgi:hypothetical protein
VICPWCEFEGWAIKGMKPRPSRRAAHVCPACFGEVPRHDEGVSCDGAEEPYTDEPLLGQRRVG